MDKTATHNMNAFSIWFKVTSDQRPHVARCQWSFLYNYKSGCSIASFYICQVVSCIWAERRQSMTMSWWRNIQQTMCTVYEANTNVFFFLRRKVSMHDNSSEILRERNENPKIIMACDRFWYRKIEIQIHILSTGDCQKWQTTHFYVAQA